MSTQEQHFYGQVTQKALIIRDGKYLFLRYPDRDPRAAGKWDLPGGRLNEGENPIEGLKREVQEEIGADVEIVRPLDTDVFVNISDKKNYLAVFEVRLIDPDISFTLQEAETAEARWFTAEEIPAVPFLYAPHKRIVERFVK